MYGQTSAGAVQRPCSVQRGRVRRALEALAAGEYERGRLTRPDLRRLLGFETGDQIDEFLKEHEVFGDYTLEDRSASVRAYRWFFERLHRDGAARGSFLPPESRFPLHPALRPLATSIVSWLR